MKNVMLLKFFKYKGYAEDFCNNGSVYFNTPEAYKNDTLSVGQYDRDETLSRLQQGELLSIKIGEEKISLNNLPATLKHFNSAQNYLQCSFYHIPFELIIDGTYSIDSKIDNEFGWHFVATPFEEFMLKLKSTGYDFSWGPIQYFDYSKFNGSRHPFMKDNHYKYQNEFRILLKGNYSEPFTVKLGSLKDISILGYHQPSKIKIELSEKD